MNNIPNNLAMHFLPMGGIGFWDKSTKNLQQALALQVNVMAEKSGLSSGHHLLMIGGRQEIMSEYITSIYDCQVTKLSLPQTPNRPSIIPHHSLQAVEPKAAHDVLLDYPEAAFDVLWIVESICLAITKQGLIHEAFRVLKPNGTLVISEITRVDNGRNGNIGHTILENDFDLFSPQHYHHGLTNAGFEHIYIEDCTELVRPAMIKQAFMNYPNYALSRLKRFFGSKSFSPKVAKVGTFQMLQSALKKSLWKYGLIYARKPKTQPPHLP